MQAAVETKRRGGAVRPKRVKSREQELLELQLEVAKKQKAKAEYLAGHELYKQSHAVEFLEPRPYQQKAIDFVLAIAQQLVIQCKQQ